ncbi:hypothetical protein [Pseudomonas baetica]|uniref:hypothetical protein n=1 Tax=Pseudomonas baetica TaxID=674054 RepID=UPI0012FDD5BA|nr:hypothetical protein [Pseudomonas baetica]
MNSITIESALFSSYAGPFQSYADWLAESKEIKRRQCQLVFEIQHFDVHRYDTVVLEEELVQA